MRNQMKDKIPSIIRMITTIGALITIISFIGGGILDSFSFNDKGIFYLNLGVCIIFIFLWFYVENHKNEKNIEYFSYCWLAFLVTVGSFYIIKIFGKSTFGLSSEIQDIAELFFNNINTIFIFLMYIFLLFPKGVDYEGKSIYAPFIISVIIIFMLVIFITFVFPKDYGRLFSGLFAFIGYCFLGSRLESYFPNEYLKPTLIFSYAAVQIFWIFEGEANEYSILDENILYMLTLIGKICFGLIITFWYEKICEMSYDYYEIKKLKKDI